MNTTTIGDYEVEVFQKTIPMIRFEDPRKLRLWVAKIGVDDEFQSVIKDSHKAETMAMMTGGQWDKQYRIQIVYSFRLTVAAGSIIDGSAIVLFPTSEEQLATATALVKTIASIVSEFMGK